MKKIFNIISLLAVSVAILSGCKDELVDTNQYAEAGVALNVYGPQPVMRGGELRFLGSNLDKITEVIIPGVSPITEINVVKAGVPSEIRIIVPKDGPEPGVVTLVAADGKEIVSKTALTYLEPIELESFSPSSVKADDVLTIKGDYLNLIHEVIFSEEVIVPEKEFISHSRYEIKVKVPVEARTGVIGVGDIDETLEENADLIPNVIYSEDELAVAQPEVASMTAERYVPEASVKISGKNLQYVATLNLPGAPAVDFTVNAAGTELEFALPAAAQDGTAILVAKSGVEVEAGEYETVVPTSLKSSPSPVKAGATLTISGNDLDLVTGIDLPGVSGVEYETAGTITLAMPETATEGDATLWMANGKSVTVAFTLVKPEFASFSENPAAAGSDIVISGTNLDLVKSVTFGGNLTVEVESAETEITVAVPTTAETGVVKLNLANGTSVDCESLTVNKPTACFITELPGSDVEIHGGQVLVVPVENEDKLESVEVNGESVKFMLNGKSLYVCLPDMAGKGTVVRLISSNGAVEYTINCIPNNIIEKVIWSGSFDLGSWSNNFEMKPAGLFDGIEVGQRIRIYGTPTGDMFQVKVNDGMWSGISISEMGEGKDCFEPDSPGSAKLSSEGYIEFLITEEIQDRLVNRGDWGNSIIFNGQNFIITKVTYYVEIPLEVTIFEGPVSLTWGDGVRFGLATSYFEGLSAGSKMIIYFTQTENWGQVQFNDGYWTNISFEELGGPVLTTDIVGDKSVTRFELTLTQSILDTILANKGDYFGVNSAYQGNGTVAFVIQGSDWIIEKITVL